MPATTVASWPSGPTPGPRDRAAAVLASLAAALALGLPPEVYPEYGALVALLLGAGLLAARGRPRLAPVCVALGLAGFNLAVSVAPGSTLDNLGRFALAGAAFALAWQLPRSLRRWPIGAVAGVGAALAVYGVYQAAGGLLASAERARELGLSAEAVGRLEQGRAFATHALPASLAGALTLSLAAAAGLLATGASRRSRWFAGALVVSIGAGLLATGSVGAWLGLVAGALAVVAPRAARWPRRRLLVLGVAAIAALVLLAAIKPGSVLDLDDPNHPLVRRADNWIGAARTAMERPAAGTGLGSFGSLYPSVRPPDANETIYAHNSWLQLAVEGGLPAVVLLAAALSALWLRGRQRLEGLSLWAFAGVVAFAAHNLVDFTAYLPGVAVPALILAGLSFGPGRSGQGSDDPADLPGRPVAARAAAALLVLLLVGTAGLEAAEGVARHRLRRAEALAREDRPVAAATLASDAARWAPWLRTVGVRAGNLLLGGETWHRQRGAALARDLVELDPASPSPWHLLGNLEQVRGHPADAWRALESAGLRHPADASLRTRVERMEQALAEAGLLQQDLPYGGETPAAGFAAGPRWGDVLLLVAAAMALLVIWRWARPGPAPAAAFGLALALLLAGFGDGGALPGVRLGWIGLIAVAAAAHLLSRRGDAAPADRGADRRLLVAAGSVALLAALSAALAPAPATARDGLVAFAAALAALVLSAELGRSRDGWLDLVVSLLGVAAAMQLVLVAAQRVGGWLGNDPAAWVEPFRAANLARPDGDFLHPGHLGTFLVAVGLALAARSWARRAGAPGPGLGFGALCVVVGLTQGARASLLALLAGGAVFLLVVVHGRARWGVGVGLLVAAVAGGVAAASRIASDPYAWSRFRIWRGALDAFGDRPWLGFGPGGLAPLGPAYALEDPGAVARFAKVFRQPHSDLLDAWVSLGALGALVLGAGLVWALWRSARYRPGQPETARPARAAAWVALAALAAHGLVDGILAQRPAVGLAAAVLLGALLGPALREAPRPWSPRGWGRALAVAGLATALLAGEALPWVAYRLAEEGRPRRAARLDPVRYRYWLEASRAVSGEADRRLALALQYVERAALAAPAVAEIWTERARVLEAACRGPLSERDTCDAAVGSWSAALARRPNDVFARRARARLQRALGDPERARTDLRMALRIEPNFLAARVDLARLLVESGRPARAGDELAALQRRAAELDGVRPSSGRARALLDLDPAELQALTRALAGAAESSP